jgi:hypothetical protein
MINKQLKFTFSFLLVTIFVFIVIVRNCESSEKVVDDKQMISFNWGIVHTDNKEQETFLNVKKNISLSSEDLLKVFIQPIKNVYVYLYLLDSGKSLALIFPRKIDNLDNNYVLGEKYYVPEGNEWFSPDESKGIETFYLLASKERLYKLETLTKEYLNTSENTKETVKTKVLAEIKNIMRRFSPFATVYAEKPILIAGTMRSPEESKDFADNAIQINAKNFYSKIIRIEHK